MYLEITILSTTEYGAAFLHELIFSNARSKAPFHLWNLKHIHTQHNNFFSLLKDTYLGRNTQ